MLLLAVARQRVASRAVAAAVASSQRAVRAGASVRSYSDRPEPSMTERLDAMGTRRIFSSEHDMFRETARRFFNDAIAPNHAEWEKEGMVSREAWTKAGELGLLGSKFV